MNDLLQNRRQARCPAFNSQLEYILLYKVHYFLYTLLFRKKQLQEWMWVECKIQLFCRTKGTSEFIYPFLFLASRLIFL